jgi:hypothetical protein
LDLEASPVVLPTPDDQMNEEKKSMKIIYKISFENVHQQKRKVLIIDYSLQLTQG